MLPQLVLECVQSEFKMNAPVWKKGSMTQTHIDVLERETGQASEFDPSGVRKALFDRWKKGECPSSVYHCAYGTVVAIYNHPEQEKDVPWSLWARILRMYTNSKNSKNSRYTIYFLANTHLRMFPMNHAIAPLNINGGYTYPCQQDIILYRAEDATRVLLHELLHAACTDTHTDIDLMEAETEAWAELLYCGCLSKGNAKEMKSLLRKQSAWILSQNRRVKEHMVTGADKEFPWRYTIGKELVWRRWGILSLVPMMNCDSLRLTHPPTDDYLKQFGVRLNSVIL